MAGFTDLPRELVLHVADCLHPLNLLALSQTCNSLRKLLDVHIEAVLPKTVAQIADDSLPRMCWVPDSLSKDPNSNYHPGPRQRLSKEDSQRLEFLLMLERDGQLSAQRLVCTGCVQTHERSFFSSPARQRQPTKRMKRNCLGWEGRLQICPHQALSYSNVIERPPAFMCELCGRERNYWYIEFLGGKLRLHMQRSLTLGVSLMVTRPDMIEVLKSRSIPFCPHTHSSDKDFLDKIRYGFDHNQSVGICAGCPACDQPARFGYGYVVHHVCDTCGTQVGVSTAQRALQYLGEIHIFVHKDLGHVGTNATDPQWIANVTMPSTKKVTIPSLLNSEP